MELASVEKVIGRQLPLTETLIIPIGDLQYGPPECDFERFKRVIEWGVENNAYYIGMGDMVDFPSPSNRDRLLSAIKSGAFYDSTVDALDLAGEQALDAVQKVLEPTKGRWLGLLEGHHYWEFEDGTTSDMRLAQFLKAPFLGTCAAVEVKFKPGGKTRIHPRCVIWAHHGRLGGKLLSVPINQLEHVLKWFEADVYLLGHHHKVSAASTSRIYPKFSSRGAANWLEHKDQKLIATGSFLRGYMEGRGTVIGRDKKGQEVRRAQGSYVERGMMNPVALGVAKIWLRPRILHGYPKLDISVEV